MDVSLAIAGEPGPQQRNGLRIGFHRHQSDGKYCGQTDISYAVTGEPGSQQRNDSELVPLPANSVRNDGTHAAKALREHGTRQ